MEDVTNCILAYECGELNFADTVALYADLIASGLAWSLQGSYGRQARRFIDNGNISESGIVLNDEID